MTNSDDMTDDTIVKGWDEEIPCSFRMRRWIEAKCMPEVATMLARCDEAERAAREAILLQEMGED